MQPQNEARSLFRYGLILMISLWVLLGLTELVIPRQFHNGYMTLIVLLWCLWGLEKLTEQVGTLDKAIPQDRPVQGYMKAVLLTLTWPIWRYSRKV